MRSSPTTNFDVKVARMKTYRTLIVFAVLAIVFAPALAAAGDTDVSDAGAAALRQLAAFRQGDYAAAYTFASAAIRRQFDQRAFEQMVRAGYPEIAASAAGRIADAEQDGEGRVLLTVRVRGANGVSVEALYEMVAEDDGWKVNAVVTRADPSV